MPAAAPSAPNAYVIDLSRWPLAVARATASIDDPAALDRTYAELDALLARNERFVSLFDLRGTRSDAPRRKRFHDWERSRRPEIQRLCVAHGLIAHSTLERGIITAYLWFGRVYVPYKIFEHEEPASAWLLARYAEAASGTR